jgi:hypothetical protein
VSPVALTTLLGRIFNCLKSGNNFGQCTSIFSAAIDLMDDDRVNLFMDKENGEPLRIILNRLAESDVSTSDM